jgi:hypothetical protein
VYPTTLAEEAMGDIVALADMVERLGVEQVLQMLTEVKEFDEACGITDGWQEKDKPWIDGVRRLLAGKCLPLLREVM